MSGVFWKAAAIFLLWAAAYGLMIGMNGGAW